MQTDTVDDSAGLERSQEPEPPGVETDRAMNLGSQLEDLFVHAMKCERWADLDARIDLAIRLRRRGPGSGRR